MEPEKDMSHHPSDEQLASFLEPSLAPRELEKLARHLDACAACEARLEEIEPVFSQLREGFRRLHSYLPAMETAGSLEDLQAAMDRLDSTGARRRPFNFTWLGGAIAAAFMVAALFITWGRGSEMRAETLLARAVSASAENLRTPQLLRIRTRSASFVRPAREEPSNREAQAIRERFATAHYNWREPLAPQSYLDWRQAVQHKRSRVIESPQESTIETVTYVGTLRNASFTLDASLTPVKGMFRFADEEWVEITVAREAAAIQAPEVAARVHEPANSPATATIESLEEREMDVFLAMDAANIGASNPIEMEVDASGAITVTAYGLTRENEIQLHTALIGTQGVTIRTVDGRREPPNPSDGIDAILRVSQDVSFEAGFLRDLESRIRGGSLSDAGEEKLLGLRRKHATKIMGQLQELRGALEQSHNSFHPIPQEPPTQTQARAVAENAAAVDRLITVLYAGQDTSASSWRDLETAFSKLEATARSYAQTLGVSR